MELTTVVACSKLDVLLQPKLHLHALSAVTDLCIASRSDRA